MKKIYLNTLTILVFLLTYSSISAQITTPTSIYERGEYMGVVKDKLLLEDLKIYAGTSGGDWGLLGNITFGGGTNGALASHELIEKAKERNFRAWLDKQNNLIKKEIEKQLGQTFSSFNAAQKAYFKDLEKKNINKYTPYLKNKYKSLRDKSTESKDLATHKMRLIQLRENEIKSGNIHNPKYGYLKINDLPINQITSLSQLPNLKEKEHRIFARTSVSELNYDNIYRKLYELPNEGILNDLYKLQVDYYNSDRFDSFERLDLMQAYLNNVRISIMFIHEPIKPIDFADSFYVENYGLNNADTPNTPFYLNDCFISHTRRTTPICSETIISEQMGLINTAITSMPYSEFYAHNIIQLLGYKSDSNEAKWLFDINNSADVRLINRTLNFHYTRGISGDKLILFKKAIDIMTDNTNNDNFLEVTNVIESFDYYRFRMSESELLMFDSMSFSDQFHYLRAANKAQTKANELFLTTCERLNGKGDAFRHAYWNALATLSLGVHTTKLLTTKHEDVTPYYTFSYKEKEMDLFNNQIGRDIAIQKGENNLLQNILDALNDGSLRYLDNLNSNDKECQATLSSKLIPTNK